MKGKITHLDLTIFLRHFATLITSGISILKSFDMLEKTQAKPAMRLLVYSIKRELLSGKDVYSSFSSHGNHFDALTCQLLKIGEHSGKLDLSLQMIADEHEKRLAFRKRMTQALAYPCLITLTAIIITISMFMFVIPRFAELFAGTELQLPTLTRALFFLSSMLNQYLIFIMLPFFPLAFFRKKLSRQLVRLPPIHHFLQKLILTRFTQNLAMTFAAGIPITRALKLFMHSKILPEFDLVISTLHNRVNSGMQLHEALQTFPCFPDLMIQMVKIGEESGTLSQMLVKTASFLEADIEQLISHFCRLLEPLIMLVLGVLIGGLIIGMYLPIFKLGSSL